MIGPLSKFDFNSKLRRYIMEQHRTLISSTMLSWDDGRGLHSSTFQLNLSRFSVIDPTHRYRVSSKMCLR
jgi:hypothetical protein